MNTDRKRALYQAREVAQAGYRTFDTETTGLEDEDQIIQWAVCDERGQVLGTGYIKPTVPISQDAQEIHGISLEQLASAPTFEQEWPKIRDLLEDQNIVIYNAQFDMRMLKQSAEAHHMEIDFHRIKTFCAMENFAIVYGDYSDYYESYRWQRLGVAITYLKIETPAEKAHDARYDAQATASIIQRLAELADKEIEPEWRAPVIIACHICQQEKKLLQPGRTWICDTCGIDMEIYHRCPRCKVVIHSPGSEHCKACIVMVIRQKNIESGEWHMCPECKFNVIEKRTAVQELCISCQQWREVKLQAAKAKIERRRKIRNEAVKRYREKKKLDGGGETKKRERKIEEPKEHLGHLIKRIHEEGKRYLHCERCELTWSQKLPASECFQIKTYRKWQEVPEVLVSKTALTQRHLEADWNNPDAIIITPLSAYKLYNVNKCRTKPLRGRGRPEKEEEK